jgi:hypothetical protein
MPSAPSGVGYFRARGGWVVANGPEDPQIWEITSGNQGFRQDFGAGGSTSFDSWKLRAITLTLIILGHGEAWKFTKMNEL